MSEVAGVKTEIASFYFTQNYKSAWIKTPKPDGFVMIRTYKENFDFVLIYELQKQHQLTYLRGFLLQSQALTHWP